MTTASDIALPVRNPLVEGRVVHPAGYRTRRFLNWFPLGLAYALLYMGRYNITVAKGALGSLLPPDAYGQVYGLGAAIYGCAFLLNGPLTDRFGGRRAMLVALFGAGAANLGMGLYTYSVLHMANPAAASVTAVMSGLFALNMYFQSFGAVAIIKVNAPWFHIRERGGFSGIFGIMISSGIWFAFDWNERILEFAKAHSSSGMLATWLVFLVPAGALGAMCLFELLFLRDRPSSVGFQDIDTGDAHADEDDRPVPTGELLRRILTHPVILTIAAIEFCTGALKDGTLQWMKVFAHGQADALAAAGKTLAGTGPKFLLDNEGLILMVAGIVGGNFAGWVSDKVFGSRRAPAAGLLYVLLIASSISMYVFLGNAWALAVLLFLMAIGILGTHGVLSGTATMDFGGRKGAATAVGVIDGFVYLGSATQAYVLGKLLKTSSVTYDAASGGVVAHGWSRWPLFLVPFSVVGLFLLLRIWHAMPDRKKKAAH
ncbi:MAG TPA: MFS transporter [Planctomycetota bacterium]|nr:MFS transporter [Planctomycetota bacterium]